MTRYEIRRDGKVWVSSTAPDCGYTAKQLRSLRDHGFRLHTVTLDTTPAPVVR